MIDKSFFLVRTNPALTGNVKLVVSSNYKLFLESFAINKALNQDRFKHFEIKKEEYYKEVIPYFFNNVENNTVFSVKYNNDVSDMYDDYKYQFDDQYFSGGFHTEDVWFQEEYEYLAPLYLKNNKLPKKFIILRVDGAGSLTEDSSAINFRKNIINNWKFVSQFDLTTNTDLGIWLDNNFVQDEGFPKYPLHVKHGETALSEVTGIDIKNGGWTTKYLNLNDLQSQNIPIFRSEEAITKLWEENQIIYPHILNMKFLFDDTPATPTTLRKYSINRYVGFYADETPLIKSVSPYEGIELNKAEETTLKNLSASEVSQIPYLKDNKFVREVSGRFYSFDPVKKGWDDNQTYWLEWEGEYYQMEREANLETDFFKTDAIIGDYIYKVVSNKTIECTLNIKYTASRTSATISRIINNEVIDTYTVDTPNGAPIDEQILKVMRRVLINELSTGKEKIKIVSQIKFNNTVINNYIENIYPTFISLKRAYQWDTINNKSTFTFRLDVSGEANNNTFQIPNYDDADLHLINIEGKYHVIKRYPLTTPNVGGKYYIQSDWAINIDEKDITSWVNNGNVTKDSNFYSSRNIQNIKSDEIPPFFYITRVSFTDIKDFDFDRVQTDYANYEYEKKNEPTATLYVEPKLYAKEYRDVTFTIRSLGGNNVRRIPILDINNRPYNIRDTNGELNTVTGKAYTADDLYRKEWDGDWSLFTGTVVGEYNEAYYLAANPDVAAAVKRGDFATGYAHYLQYGKNEGRLPNEEITWVDYSSRNVSMKRKYYREEHYIWRDEDVNNNNVYEVNFKENSDPKILTEGINWGDSGKNEIGTKEKLPTPKAKKDPNLQYDPNYVPVSSEYVASDELWEIRNGSLTDIWRKNQTICKWGFLNSNGLHDYPYRLNYSLEMGDIYNREPNPFGGREIPQRKNFDLEYFYRFGLNNPTNYSFYSLHLKNTSFDDNTGFNTDRYISTDFDYFEYLFKSDQETYEGLLLTNKYSTLVSDNEYSDPYTVFRGVKYRIFDVDNIIKETDPDDVSTVIIDDIVTKTNSKYEDYKFTIIFAKKSSMFDFNAGKGNGNSGIDVYLNDIWKNIIIHIYIDSDETIQISDPAGLTHNAETCPIDFWYHDIIERREINPTEYDKSEFKINGFGIGLRPRDFMLSKILFILNEKNYLPIENKEEVQFIHIYADGSTKIMTYENTDFIINTDFPDEVLTKEFAYKVNAIDVGADILPVNNSIINRIVIDDDPNSPTGTAEFTSDGGKVGVVIDLNSYNDYPIAKEIVDGSDSRMYWELQDETDPSIFRHSGPYAPIFRNIPLFRPLGYLAISSQAQEPKLPSGNWKFYDIESSNTNPKVVGFASIPELMFSKVNPATNILKIQDPSGKIKSIYPMVDEYGLDFDSRFLFASNWEPSFNYLSRKGEVEENQYPSIAGYTIEFDGNKDFVRIADTDKFNIERYFIDDLNYENYIQNQPEGERTFFRKTFLNVHRNDLRSYETKLLINQEYTFSVDFANYTSNPNDNIYAWIEIINDPNDATQTGSKFFLISSLILSSSNHTLTFNTNKYVSYTGAVGAGTPNFHYSANYSSGQDLPTTYKYGNSVNVRVNFRLSGTSTNEKVDIFPFKLNILPNGSYDNFLDIDVYPTDANGIIQYQNSVGIWGGYIKTLNEVGEVSSYPFRIKDLERYNTYSQLAARLHYFIEPTSNKVWSNLNEGRSFKGNVDIIDSRNSKIVRISNTDGFTFEPERWTDIEDGRNITYLGQRTGDSTVECQHTLRWYTSYRTEKKIVLKQVIHKYESIQEKIANEPKPVKRKSLFIPGLLRHHAIATPTYKMPTITSKSISALNRGAFSTVKNVVDYYNTNKLRGIIPTPLPSFVRPIGSISFIPTTTFLPTPLPPPRYETENIREEYPYSVEALPEKIEFQIIPDNGEPIYVSVTSRHPEDGNALNITEVLGLVNNIITPNYEATLLSSGGNYKDVIIKSRYAGSYYNFRMVENSSHIEVLTGSSVYATDEVTTSEKFSKTSIKEGKKRITGYITDTTVEFWIKVGAWNKEHETILYKGEDTSLDPWKDINFNNFTYIIGRDKNTDLLAFRTCHKKLNGQFEKHTLISKSDITDGAWHHVAFVIDVFNKRKSIYIDGKLDNKIDDFLTASYPNAQQRDIIALFLDNRHRFMPGLENTTNFPDFASLASKIRTNAQDSKTLYWLDVIKGYRNMNYWDKQTQLHKTSVTINEAFQKFQENFEEVDYYLNTSKTNTWHILIATDSTISLGRRNFGGAIDELRFWNYARTSEQIRNNHNFILRPESYLDPLKTLVAYYRFDEGKGVNTIKDLMDGKMISDLARWCRVRSLFVNNGFTESETDEMNFFQFETDYYTGSNIQINLDEIEWIVSGADILGFSDERYTVSPPPASTNKSISSEEKPIFPKSQYVLAKKEKPRIEISNVTHQVKVPMKEVTVRSKYVQSIVNTSSNNKPKSIIQTIHDIIKKPIIPPKKIIAQVVKAPTKIVKAIKKLFGKKR